MATLTNPVEEQNIVDRFKDYVTDHANGGIVWANNNNPKYTAVSPNITVVGDAYMGGSTSGKSIGITGADIKADGTDVIDASSIYWALNAETNRYTSIRKLRAKLNVTGEAGDTNDDIGPVGDYGIQYDVTKIAYLSDDYLQTIDDPDNAGVAKDQVIDDTKLETLFDNFKAAYNTKRDTTVTITKDVCHASCHTSCHSSRGRR
jgi:hypothetical protein